MSEQDERRIHVPVLARVEGEGALDLSIHNGAINNLQLRIFEPPRLFEKFLEGHSYKEVPDMVARICGICPVAYQMSAINALESMFQVSPDPWIRSMRRALYCGEWIQSHSLHIHLLAAPDFLGFDNVIAMVKQYPQQVNRGLGLQAIGNKLIALFGGRSVHPVGSCVGGFYSAPPLKQVDELVKEIETLLPDAEQLIHWTASLALPQQEQDFTCVALRHASEYPLNDGRLVSNKGLDIPIDRYQEYFSEFQVPHSTSLQSTLDEKPYLVGPLARINLNLDRLPDNILNIIQNLDIEFPSHNMFHSIIARAIEIYFALQEALRILTDYTIPEQAAVSVVPRAGTGYGCTEAPRGILWHKYECDQDGKITNAVIIPPTSQNQAQIELDLLQSLTAYGLQRTDDELRQRGEMIIRNYDPCISCSTHFLKIKVERS